MRSAASRDAGFTLTELLVVITVLAIIGAAIATTTTTGLRKQSQVQDRNDALAQVRTAMQRVSRDIRSTNPLVIAEDDQIGLCEVQSVQTKEVTYELVADGSSKDLVVVTNVVPNCNTWMSSGTQTILLRNVANGSDTAVFGYSPRTDYTAPTGTSTTVDPATCAISGTSPVQYDPSCVGTVSIHLQVQPSSLSQPVDLTDSGTELRNAA
jgi:prepilin-type N-terminal cleavage/methylation domain-containing protein